MRDLSVAETGRRRLWAFDGDLHALAIEWHERDLGEEIAAIMVIDGDTVLCQVNRRLLGRPSVYLLRPRLLRDVATGWEVVVVRMADLLALVN